MASTDCTNKKFMEYSSLLSTLVFLVGAGVSAKEMFSGHSNMSNVTTPPPIPPSPFTAITPSSASLVPEEVALPVHLTVIVLVTVLVAILFVAIYIQLILVIWFGYKLLSYQTVLLFSVLLWAALRLTLFSFYYYHCCESVRLLLSGVAGWVIVSFPAVLQYFSLAVLVSYFGDSLFKVFERRQEMATLTPPYRKMTTYRALASLLWFSFVFVFLVGNISFYVAIGNDIQKDSSLLPTFRVLLQDGLFLATAVILGVCIVLMYTTRAGKDVLEAQNVHKCWPMLVSVSLVLLFLSRAIYNIIAVRLTDINVFGNGYTFTTDMADNEFYTSNGKHNMYGYVAYFAVLVIWEIIPTYMIVVFFRVRIPSKSSRTCRVPEDIEPVRENHFFENPHRFDKVLHHANARSIVQVFVRSTFITSDHKLSIETISLNVRPTQTIMELKRMVHKAGALSSPMKQKLILAGEELSNARTVKSYNVKENTLIIDQVSWISAEVYKDNELLGVFSVSCAITDSVQRVAEIFRAKLNASKQNFLISLFSWKRNLLNPPENSTTLFDLLFLRELRKEKNMNHKVVCYLQSTFSETCDNRSVSDQNSIMLFVKALTGEIIELPMLSPTDSISYVKYKIYKSTGILPCAQMLIHFRKQLEDKHTLSYYNIHRVDMLHLVLRLSGGGEFDSHTIYIITLTNTIMLAVDTHSSVLDVKKQIAKRIQCRPEDQVLHFRNVVLEDEKTLNEYSIPKNYAVHLSFKPKMGIITFYVYLPDGKCVTLFLPQNETVHRCVEIIQKEMLDRKFDISFGTTILKEGSRLNDYDIQDGVMIHVVPRDGAVPIELMLHGKTMKQTSMSVDLSDTVLSLKMRISNLERLSIAKLQLFLGDRKLEDHKLLSDYQVRKMTIIHVQIVADEAESIRQPTLDPPESKRPCLTGTCVSKIDITEQKGACGIGPCVTKTDVPRDAHRTKLSSGTAYEAETRQRTIETLMSKTNVTDAQLESEIESGDLYPVAGYFNDVEHYIHNLELNKSEMADVRRRTHELGNQLGIVYALELWKNSTVSPTYKSLINILLYLKHVEVARSICLFLKNLQHEL